MGHWRWLVLGGWLLGCGSVVSDDSCVPGRQVSCDCPDGTSAVQICAANGTFESCQCEEDDDAAPTAGGRTSGSGGTSSRGGHGGGAGTAVSSGGSGADGTAGRPPKPLAYSYGDMSPCETEGSSLFFSGDSSDFIHRGQDLLTVARFSEQSSESVVSFSIEPSGMEHGSWWSLDFSSRQLDAPLTVGEYLGAERYPFETYLKPGLSISGDGRGCNVLTGKFEVTNLVWAGPDLARFDVAFEQHCEGGSAALRGCLHYDSGIAGAAGAANEPDPSGGAGGDRGFEAGASWGGDGG